jgi:signal recognition particle subunit SRP72
VRLPKGVVLGVTPPPDPERWLKKSERTNFGQRRRKGGAGGGGGGATQGSAADVPAAVESGKGGSGNAKGKGKKKK